MTETFKKCWSCDARTPYEQGWCDNCYQEIPVEIQQAVYIATGFEPFAGKIRMAVCDALQMQRRQEQRIKETGWNPPPKINLNDLDI